MTRRLRFVALIALSVFLLSGSTAPAKPVGIPLPPPPVLCGCVCDDGSFVITHAPSGDACPKACEAACSGSSEF